MLRSYLRAGVLATMLLAACAVSAACSVPTAGTTSTPAVGVNAPSSVSAADELTTSASAQPSTSVQLASDQTTFGETYKWVDGLEVTVSAPTPITPSASAAVDPSAAYLGFTVIIVNNTGSTYEATLFSSSVQSGDKEGDQVFDSANGYTGAPTTAILNGRQSTFTIGFGVSNPNDVVMQVDPGFDYKPAFFTGTSTGRWAAPTVSCPATSAAGNPPATDATATASDQTTFGETYKWVDGLEVTVSAPTPSHQRIRRGRPFCRLPGLHRHHRQQHRQHLRSHPLLEQRAERRQGR